jgi:hypothetical protein
MSDYVVLFILSLLIVPGCLAAVAGSYFRNDSIPLTISILVLVAAFVADLFGRRELFILLGRIKGRFRKVFNKRKYMQKKGEIYHIHGKGPWREIWNHLTTNLHNDSCRNVQLDISIPYKNEDFFGEWENMTKAFHGNEDWLMSCSIPLVVSDKRLGMLRLFFDHQNNSRNELLELTLKLSQFCENSIGQYLEAGTIDNPQAVLPFQENNSLNRTTVRTDPEKYVA